MATQTTITVMDLRTGGWTEVPALFADRAVQTAWCNDNPGCGVSDAPELDWGVAAVSCGDFAAFRDDI